MGKGTDKLYITHSEWSSNDAFSASVGAQASSRAQRPHASLGFRRLPFNFCAASLQPFRTPVCTADGIIFDREVILTWLERQSTNPVDGRPLSCKDLIRLNFARNADTDATSAVRHADRAGLTDGRGDLIDPVSFKVLTDNTHIVAVRHGDYANVFAFDTIDRMNLRPKMWQDLVDDQPFSRRDIITLQDPQNASSRDLSQFKYLRDGGDALLTPEQLEERSQGSVNIEALGRVGDKVLRAKEAVAKARQGRDAGGDVNRSSATGDQLATRNANGSSITPASRQQMIREKKLAHNAATYTTGAAAASFTSTGLTPETTGERAVLSEEEWLLKPKRVRTKGYARIETNLGDLTMELLPEFAPKAVWNFIRLSQRGYYRGVAFHRNIRNFMIQGGDPTGTGKGGTSCWGKNFQDEFEGPNTHSARGIMSMANKGKNTNSSQFFIMYKPAKHLDRKHTIFARAVAGLDVLDKMENVETDGSDRPLNKIVIRDVVIFVDPFDEFLKEKGDQDKCAARKEQIAQRGGTEDDRTTWTGKRIRDDGSVSKNNAASGVGKYLRANADGGGRDDADDVVVEEDLGEEAMWEEQQPKKKAKTGGFGNFDSW